VNQRRYCNICAIESFTLHGRTIVVADYGDDDCGKYSAHLIEDNIERETVSRGLDLARVVAEARAWCEAHPAPALDRQFFAVLLP
jgi:hypothetical protein